MTDSDDYWFQFADSVDNHVVPLESTSGHIHSASREIRDLSFEQSYVYTSKYPSGYTTPWRKTKHKGWVHRWGWYSKGSVS